MIVCYLISYAEADTRLVNFSEILARKRKIDLLFILYRAPVGLFAPVSKGK